MDEMREEFEKSDFFDRADNWIKWDGEKYIKNNSISYNSTADSWERKMNHELSIFSAGRKSRDEEIEDARYDVKFINDVNIALQDQITKQQAEIKQLTEDRDLWKQSEQGVSNDLL